MFIRDLAVLGLTATLGLFAAPVDASKVNKRFDCPSDNSTFISLSFVAEGNKIYFNNHCKEAMQIYYTTPDGEQDYGFTVSAKTKGNDKVGGDVISVTAVEA